MHCKFGVLSNSFSGVGSDDASEPRPHVFRGYTRIVDFM